MPLPELPELGQPALPAPHLASSGVSPDEPMPPPFWRWVWLPGPWYVNHGKSAAADRHADLWSATVERLDGDDEWLAWWQSHAPRASCALHVRFEDAEYKAHLAAMSEEELRIWKPREGLTRSQDEVRVWMRYEADWENVPADLEGFVHEQVMQALEQARRGLKMPPAPPPPWSK